MATLTILQGPDRGRTLSGGDEPTLLGRASGAAPLTDQSVSRRHAELRQENGYWLLEDLRSANGTYVNERRITKPTRLKHGDMIRMGGTVMVWSGDERVLAPRGQSASDLVNFDAGAMLDASAVTSVASNDDSVILASPAAADAIRAWHVMAQLVESIGVATSIEGLLERVMDILFEEVPVQRAFLLMKSAETGEFEPVVVRYRGQSATPDKIAASRTIIDHVVSRKEGVLSTNAMSDQRFASRRRSGSIQAIGLRSVICAPILSRDEVLGVIHVDSAMSSHIYTEEQLRLVVAIGRMSGMAIDNTRLVAQRMDTTRLAAAGQAVATLSHSIRNILQGMQSGADVVEMGLSRQQIGLIDQGWQIVQRNLEKTLGLSMNMLAYAKERVPQLEMTLLNAIVGEVIQLSQRRADDKGIMIRTDLDEPMPPIPVDADGIQQVILNLLSNAIDAVPKTTGAINIRTRYEAEPAEAVVTIGDNGPGIAPEQMEHLFEPFRSTKGHRGTGLGLAVARKIVDEHGGTLDIQSEPGHGTLVTIRLRAVQDLAADSAATHTPPARPAASEHRPAIDLERGRDAAAKPSRRRSG